MDPISIGLGLAKLTGLDKKLGRWLGGENGEQVASKVVAIAQQVTGTSSPTEALEAVQRAPGKQVELEEALLANEHELEVMAYKDRADARKMQVAALQSDDKFAKRFVYYFAIAWSAFAFVYIYMITFTVIPENNQRFADIILGFLLGTVLAGMFAFFYGSSAGNERRAELQDLKSITK